MTGLYAILAWMAIACLIGMYYMGLFIGALLVRVWNFTQDAYKEYMEG